MDAATRPLPALTRIRFALRELNAQRLIDNHRLVAADAMRSTIELARLQAHPGAGLVLVLRRVSAPGPPEVRLIARTLPLSLAATLEPRGATLLSEQDSTRRCLTAELSRPDHPDSHRVPVLSPEQASVVRRLGARGISRAWRSRCTALELHWTSVVTQLPVTICRWTADGTGESRCELRATMPPDEAQIMVRVLAAHLRRLGADPDEETAWLEEWLTSRRSPVQT